MLDAKCPNGADHCDYLHHTELSPNFSNPGQEWSLVRFPFSALPPRPHPPLASSPSYSGDLPRRRFRIQNVASGGFMTAIGLASQKDEPNVIINPEFTAATSWFFLHTVLDKQWVQLEDMFAIVTGSGSRLGTLDHFVSKHICASYRRFHPHVRHHMWNVIPRDGAFVFWNFGTGKILCQRSATGPLDFAPATETNNSCCQWRLIDADTGKICPVLYDSTLSIMPPELGGQVAAPLPIPTAQPEFRTEPAPLDLHTQLFDQIKHEHELIHDLFAMGYKSLVIMPQRIRGWRNGRVHDTVVRDEESVLRCRKLQGHSSHDTSTKQAQIAQTYASAIQGMFVAQA